MYQNLSLKEKFRVGFLHEEGYSIHQISQKMNINRVTVRKWIDQDPTPNSKKNPEKRGRKRKASEEQLGRIKKILLGGKHVGTKRLNQKIREKIRLNISGRTVCRYVSKLNLVWGKYRRVPFLTEKHKEKRYEWALKNEATDWNAWIFSDEKIFRAGAAPVGVRYRKGHQPFYPTKRWSGQVFVWYAIHKTGIFKAQVVESRLNNVTYRLLLEKGLLPGYQPSMIFQQDNARPHIAKEVKQWMVEKKVQCCNDWPANSPDLNPIENLWSKIDFEVRRRCPRSKETLRKIVMLEIKKITRSEISNLIDSMPRRISQVKKSNGGNIKY